MIQHKLLLIEAEDTFRAIKIKKQEEFIKDFAQGFGEWIYINALILPKLPIKDLLLIYMHNAENTKEEGGRSFKTLL